MAQERLLAAAAEIARTGRITAEDVLRLRRAMFGDGRITAEEADALFLLDRHCTESDSAWPEFFVEAVANCAVRQQEPPGYVSDTAADWLIAHIAADGSVKTATELELLVTVLEKAQQAPERLVRYALEAVKRTVLEGSGPARRGDDDRAGTVTEADVALLRRILYAFGGDRHVAVTRAEAEILFDINDAAAGSGNHPSWSDLFVKAIASAVLCASGYVPPTRDRALREDRWLAEREGHGSFLARMLGSLLPSYRPSGAADPGDPANAQPAPAAAESVSEADARWLAARLDRDGRLHENERALLAFLQANALAIHPALRSAIRRAA